MWQGTCLGFLHGLKDREAWVASLPPLGALAHEEHLSCRAGQGLVSVVCQGPAPKAQRAGKTPENPGCCPVLSRCFGGKGSCCIADNNQV